MANDLRIRYEEAYVDWLDADASAESLEERLRAAQLLANETERCMALGLTQESIDATQADYRDFS